MTRSFEEVHREQRDGFDVVLLLSQEDPREFDHGNATPEAIAEFNEKIESGAWIVFTAMVVGRMDGKQLGDDTLGGCCYLSARDFRENSGYYEDMVNVAMSEARRVAEWQGITVCQTGRIDVERMVDDALDALCLHVQRKLGVTDGGQAAIYWSGEEESGVVRAYIEHEIANRPQPFWHVRLYLTDRAFGGHEEGGWYYECGTPHKHAQNGLFMDQESATEFAAYLNEHVAPGLNEGRNADTGSVLSEGCYRFLVGQGEAMPYPSVIPHYE